MGRSVQDIEQSLKDSFTTINPSLDLEVGPTYDYTLAPVPKEIAFAEQAVTDLQVFYSPDFPEIATPQQARELATNFGISVSVGERARGVVVFFRYTPPPTGSELRVVVGQLISTRDLQFTFQSLETKSMLGDFAETYYNPQTQRYEISVLAQATLPGSLYNLPAERLVVIASGTTADSFNGVFQPNPMAGGKDAETSADLASRTLDQFKGINLNSINGLDTLAKRYKPVSVLDTKVVKPTDREEFRRPTSGPALDFCLLGSETLTFTEDYLARGGETSVVMTTTTAQLITQVQINNTVLDFSLWEFAPDTSPAYRGSTRARNTIQLFTPLAPNDIVSISGTQNFLLNEMQAVLAPDEDSIYQTDILVRSFVDLPITIGVTVRITATTITNIANLESLLNLAVFTYIEDLPIPDILTATGLKEQIRAALPSVRSIDIYEMRRKNKSVTMVETIQRLKNERPVFDSASSALAIKV